MILSMLMTMFVTMFMGVPRIKKSSFVQNRMIKYSQLLSVKNFLGAYGRKMFLIDWKKVFTHDHDCGRVHVSDLKYSKIDQNLLHSIN